jgi:hypothetical protein
MRFRCVPVDDAPMWVPKFKVQENVESWFGL